MTRYELINENKALSARKNSLFEKANSIKSKIESLFTLAVVEESQINDLTREIESDKGWYNSEVSSLHNIKKKLADEYDHLNYLNGQLERLYEKKKYAYDCKDYHSLPSIKGDIEDIKRRKGNTHQRIDSLKRQRDNQSDYISRKKSIQDSRYQNRSRHIEKKKKYTATCVLFYIL